MKLNFFRIFYLILIFCGGSSCFFFAACESSEEAKDLALYSLGAFIVLLGFFYLAGLVLSPGEI